MNAIEITNLKYRYHDGTEALRGISFRVAPGECIALLGPNGSGKSTLLLHLNGLLPEKINGDGAVKIYGEPLAPENLEKIRRQVGLVFQDPDDQLFCPTVAEDVAFGPQQLGLSETEIAARVKKSLAQVGLAGFEQRADASFEPRRKTARLSGGRAGVRTGGAGAGRADERPRPARPARVQGAAAGNSGDQADCHARFGTGGGIVPADRSFWIAAKSSPTGARWNCSPTRR